MKTKKLLCIFLAVVILLSAFPFTVLASEEYTSEDGLYDYDILFTDENSGYTYIELTYYNGDDKNVIVPSEIDGYYVKGLMGTFSDNSTVESVALSQGIEYIDQASFSGCVLSLSLPSSLKYIGTYAFAESEIKSITFSEGLVGIAPEAFYGCVFEDDVVFPESLKYICNMAFEECCVHNVYFGKNVMQSYEIEYDYAGNISNIDDYIYDEMGWNPFYNNQCDVNLTISSSNPHIKMDGRAIYTTDNTQLLLYLAEEGKTVDVVINDGVRAIKTGVFPAGMSIGTLALSRTVEQICANAFFNVGIKNLLFAKNGRLKNIGEYAFADSYFSGELVIPKSVEYIGDYAFCDNDMTSLSFEQPSSCKEIGSRAFFCCTKLKEIFIPNSVETLGKSDVFRNCNHLESVIFEDNSRIKHWTGGMFLETPLKYLDTGRNNGVEQISTTCFDKKAQLDTLDLSNCPNLKVLYLDQFRNMPFKEINLENTAITSIPQDCFIYCNNLEKVTLPDTVSSISNYGFAYCPKLKSVNIDEVVSISATAFAGCPLIPEASYKRTTSSNDDYKYVELTDGIAITDYIGSDGNVVIPETIDDKPVIKISQNAFSAKKMDTVEFPDTIKSIETNAFRDTSLQQTPVLPKSLRFIGNNAFSGTGLTGDLIIPDSVITIASGAFDWCRFSSITIGSNVKNIGRYAFRNCLCETITIPDSVTSLDSHFIDGKYLKSIHFGSSGADIEKIFKLDDYYGNYETVESITVSADNERYCTVDGVLYSKDMSRLIFYPAAKQDESYTVAGGVKTITKYALSFASNLKNVTVGDSVECIEDYGFFGSPSIESVYISGNVSEIGIYAFSNMQSLKFAEFGEGLNVSMLGATFAECDNLETVIFSPNSSVDLMISTFAASGIRNITLPDTVKTFNQAFYKAENLEQIKLPDSLEYMIESFIDSGIRSIEIPSKVTVIASENFKGCYDLADVKLGNATAVLSKAFADCKSLESIDLTGVVYVADDAFDGCDNLKKLYFTKDEQDSVITENEFQGNEVVETIVVGNSITEIQDYAFADCVNLETALIADSVTEIADTAFDNCDNLNIVCRPNSYAMFYARDNEIPYTTFIVAPIEDQKYTGSEITPELDVKAQGRGLTLNNDYAAVYSDNIKVGTAKVNVLGLGDYSIFASLVKFNIVADDSNKTDDNHVTKPDAKPDTPVNETKKPPVTKPSVSGDTGDTENRTNQSSSGTQGGKNNQTAQSNQNNQGSSISPEKSKSAVNSNGGKNAGTAGAKQQTTAAESTDNAEAAVGSGEKTAENENAETTTVQSDSAQEPEETEKENIFVRIFKSIRNFFTKIFDFIKSLFSK